MWVIFFLNIFCIQCKENQFGSPETFIKLPFLGKLLSRIHLHFNPVSLLHPDEDGTFISDSTKYELNWRSLHEPRKDIPDVTCR